MTNGIPPQLGQLFSTGLFTGAQTYSPTYSPQQNQNSSISYAPSMQKTVTDASSRVFAPQYSYNPQITYGASSPITKKDATSQQVSPTSEASSMPSVQNPFVSGFDPSSSTSPTTTGSSGLSNETLIIGAVAVVVALFLIKK